MCLSETEVPSPAPTNQLADQGDGTVVDEQTGLMWVKCAAGLSGALCDQGTASSVNWQGALDLAANSNQTGHNDWRLPNIKELRSIVEQRCNRPAMNQDSAAFPNTPPSFFWSSSPSAGTSSNAWIVDFNSGVASNFYSRGLKRHVRLVRAGQ